MPSAEEQHEAGQPETTREQRRRERRCEQGACDEDALAVRQTGSMPERA